MFTRELRILFPSLGKQSSNDETAAAAEQRRADERAFSESLVAERNRFLRTKSEQAKAYDQIILTFSAGAIGISLTFAERIAPSPVHPWLMYSSWIAFGLAVVSVVASFVVSQVAIENELVYIDIVHRAVTDDSDIPAYRVNRHTELTKVFNISSGVMFIFGIGFLVAFGMANWPLRGTTARHKVVASTNSAEIQSANVKVSSPTEKKAK